MSAFIGLAPCLARNPVEKGSPQLGTTRRLPASGACPDARRRRSAGSALESASSAACSCVISPRSYGSYRDWSQVAMPSLVLRVMTALIAPVWRRAAPGKKLRMRLSHCSQ